MVRSSRRIGYVVDGRSCVMKMQIRSSFGSIQKRSRPRRPRSSRRGWPASSWRAGSMVTEKPRPKPTPL